MKFDRCFDRWNRERTKSEVSGDRKSKRRNSLTAVPSAEAIMQQGAVSPGQAEPPARPAGGRRQEPPDPSKSPKPWMARK